MSAVYCSNGIYTSCIADIVHNIAINVTVSTDAKLKHTAKVNHIGSSINGRSSLFR